MSLTREAFLALSSVIWADGEVVEAEAMAYLGAARAIGLRGEDLQAVVDATERPVALESVDVDDLSKSDREFLYAIAVWLMAVDEDIDASERQMVETVGDRLGLSAGDRDRARLASLTIAQFAADQGHHLAVLDLIKEVDRRQQRFAVS